MGIEGGEEVVDGAEMDGDGWWGEFAGVGVGEGFGDVGPAVGDGEDIVGDEEGVDGETDGCWVEGGNMLIGGVKMVG